MEKIGFGGGCHWCTEAVFLSLKGVYLVEQGWISAEENKAFSEAVIVHFDPDSIPLEILTAIHLHTHSSSSDHLLRSKYRSALYTFAEEQHATCIAILERLQTGFDHRLITQVMQFQAFRPSSETWQDYYYKKPDAPFCESHIHPKLRLLLARFSSYADAAKIGGNLIQVLKQ